MAQDDSASDTRIGQAVLRGVGIGIPAAIVFLMFAVWAITPLDLGDSFATALLPGVLLGGFAGGFTGVALTMD